MKKQTQEKLDIQFIQSVASDFDQSITKQEAKKAHQILIERGVTGVRYYEALKEYFLN